MDSGHCDKVRAELKHAQSQYRRALAREACAAIDMGLQDFLDWFDETHGVDPRAVTDAELARAFAEWPEVSRAEAKEIKAWEDMEG